MGKTYKQEILNWKNEDVDVADSLHIYFEEEFGRWYWPEVSQEAQDIWEGMFGSKLVYPQDSIVAAAAAQSAFGIYSGIGAALGIDPYVLERVFSFWVCYQDAQPSSISFRELERLVAVFGDAEFTDAEKYLRAERIIQKQDKFAPDAELISLVDQIAGLIGETRIDPEYGRYSRLKDGLKSLIAILEEI